MKDGKVQNTGYRCEGWNDPIGRFLYRWRIRAVLPYVEGYLLDVGCGVNRLVKSYGNGIGVDVFPWEGADMVVEDSSHLPFDADTFDTVTFVACLNHIPNRAAVLREARRVLRPGGRIVITMLPPAISRIWHALRGARDSDHGERGMGGGEVYGLTRKSIGRLLEESGFAVDRQHSFMFFTNSVTVGHSARH